MRKSLVLTTLSILVISTLALVGCAKEPVDVAAPPTVTPSPVATPVALEAPEPILESTCDDLVPAASYGPLSTTPLKATDPFSFEVDEYSSGIPRQYALGHLQATQCLWINDAPRYDENGSAEGFTSLWVTVLPDAAAAWAHYAKLYELDEAEPVDCNGSSGEDANCWWTGLVGDSLWLDIQFSGMKYFGGDSANRQQAQTLVDTVTANVIASTQRSAWTPPQTSLVIDPGCPSVLSAETIAGVVGGEPSAVGFHRGPIGGTALAFEAETQVGSDPCRWFTPTTQTEYGLPVQVLEGGEWAWAAAHTTDRGIRDATALELDGLAEGDSAWLRASDKIPTVDVILDGNWISLSLYPETVDTLDLDAGTSLTSLAQGIVDGLR
ncbi:hypothetical protein EYE40_08365 [Glaciihabitans arcticus]|uniref:DUF3558 domain-containing protein n=1 Tax=Glaciihabitans arcticus TaxID=2668039 RepID=A0A4Q9GW28_9MICO|nr:hypothetical protein [Glaciihabitans arcticus]TBN57407.1 hypothetical protein EYE40_08365 [Glaciihabitans arcticus]